MNAILNFCFVILLSSFAALVAPNEAEREILSRIEKIASFPDPMDPRILEELSSLKNDAVKVWPHLKAILKKEDRVMVISLCLVLMEEVGKNQLFRNDVIDVILDKLSRLPAKSHASSFYQALGVLGRMRAERSIKEIAAYLKSDIYEIRYASVEALGMINSRDAVSQIKAFKEESVLNGVWGKTRVENEIEEILASHK